MNTLTAAEIKRRGMAAIDEALRHGPVHLIKRNKPAAVVLSAKDYERLSQGRGKEAPGMTAAEWLLRRPVTGNKRKRDLDNSLRDDREDWG
jgi:prevent-host-death family protein